MILTLNIIGGGRLGQTLGHLWHRQQTLRIGQIVCTSRHSAEQAAAFIGAGRATDTLSDLQPADVWLVATPDRYIAKIAKQLVAEAPLAPGNIAFHCSGALPATALDALKPLGVKIASIHPVHSFVRPRESVENFSGSYCSYEGEPQALEKLLPLFQALHAELLAIDSDAKSLYHAGSVIACNYLVPLLEASLQCLQAANLSRTDAARLLAPLVHATADNVLQKSAAAALTGPIARGDSDTVERQLQALVKRLPDILPLYRALGSATARIARGQDNVQLEALERIEKTLSASDKDT